MIAGLRAALCLLMLTLASPVAATETGFEAPGRAAEHLVIESTTDLWIIRPIIEAFQQANSDVGVTYVELTTNVLNKRATEACRDGVFVADLIISSSIDQQVKLVNDGCAQALPAETGASLPDWAKWRSELFGLTFEPAVIVYNKRYFEDRVVPLTRFDLIDLMRDSDDLVARIGTYDIEASGVGYLFAFEDSIQAGTWGRLLESLGRNAAQLFCCTSEILDRVADGRLLVGYNVLGSYALAQAEKDPRIGIVAPLDYTLVLSRAALVPRHAKAPATARRFLEFMLSDAGRALLSGASRLLSPVDGAQTLADLLGRPAADGQSFRPITMSPALMIGLDRAKREVFLRQWRNAMHKDADPDEAPSR